MNAIISHLLAMGFGFVLALGGFIYLNRKKPEQVDKAETFLRKD